MLQVTMKEVFSERERERERCIQRKTILIWSSLKIYIGFNVGFKTLMSVQLKTFLGFFYPLRAKRVGR